MKKKIVLIILAAVLLLGAVAVFYLMDQIRRQQRAAEEQAELLRLAEELAAQEVPEVEPTPEPIVFHAEYFPLENGLFQPDRPLSSRVLGGILSEQLGQPVAPVSETEAYSFAAFRQELYPFFSVSEVENALLLIDGSGGDTITRAEAAVALNALFSIPAGEGSELPDVAPDYWACGAVAAAAERRQEPLPEPGFVMIDSILYYAGENGYFVKNQRVGTLLFDNDGRYTSGNADLDAYVTDLLREVSDDSMPREERLSAAYLSIRDRFTYLKRNYYKVGDNGFALNEALTMYSTGSGNCYCYAGAFWAAARALGYDAYLVSGTFGAERAPHGWVEAWQDGVRYTYDVEIEMVRRRETKQDPRVDLELFAMTDSSRAKWGYREYTFVDEYVPWETNGGLLPK